jgi:hypothetical protein
MKIVISEQLAVPIVDKCSACGRSQWWSKQQAIVRQLLVTRPMSVQDDANAINSS